MRRIRRAAELIHQTVQQKFGRFAYPQTGWFKLRFEGLVDDRLSQLFVCRTVAVKISAQAAFQAARCGQINGRIFVVGRLAAGDAQFDYLEQIVQIGVVFEQVWMLGVPGGQCLVGGHQSGVHVFRMVRRWSGALVHNVITDTVCRFLAFLYVLVGQMYSGDFAEHLQSGQTNLGIILLLVHQQVTNRAQYHGIQAL